MLTMILLIRHGETDWNRQQRIQGQRDVPLSAFGEKQARRLGQRLKNIPLHAAYSSDSQRSLRTAEIALEGRGLAVQVSADLRERDFGRWEGLTWEEVHRDFPEEAERSRREGFSFTAPGGESWNQLQERVFQKVRRIQQQHPDQTVAVFTHGGPCKAAVLSALELPPTQWRLWMTDNASIHRLVWDERIDGHPSPWRLKGFNDIAHLEGMARAPASKSSSTLSEKEV